MRYAKTISESRFESRKVVMPDQINPNGALFGGELMAWIDKMAYMTAQRHAERAHVVTVNIDQISFQKPIRVGDHVILASQMIRAGKTSMDIRVTVEREDGCYGNRETATQALLTFVALDGSGKPIPVPALVVQTEDEKYALAESHLRLRIKKRFQNFVVKRDRIRVQKAVSTNTTVMN